MESALHTSRRRIMFTAIVALTFMLAMSNRAAADDDHAADAPSFILGAVGAALHDGSHGLYAGGPFIELLLVPHTLHFEVTALFGRAGHDTATVLDFVFKVPYHLSDRIELFGGLGLTLPVIAAGGQTEIHPGLTVSAGLFYWFMKPLGVVAAGIFNVLSTPSGAHVEGGAIAGIAMQI